MLSSVRDLWPVVWQPFLLVVMVAALDLLYVGTLICHFPTFEVILGTVCMCIVCPIALLEVRKWRRNWRFLSPFVESVRRFRTAHGNRFVLRYAPELDGAFNPEDLLKRAEGVLAELEGTLGPLTFWNGQPHVPLAPRPFRRRKVYLYISPRDGAFQEMTGPHTVGGVMLPLFCIAVAYSSVPFDELLKHELTHLFACRWNVIAVPLLSEGFATWLAGTCGGRPVDTLAVPLARSGEIRLRALLDLEAFYQGNAVNQHYVLAGSFTGFLLRRVGRDAFRRLYARPTRDAAEFEAEFERELGLSLEAAEQSWREGVLRTEVI